MSNKAIKLQFILFQKHASNFTIRAVHLFSKISTSLRPNCIVERHLDMYNTTKCSAFPITYSKKILHLQYIGVTYSIISKFSILRCFALETLEPHHCMKKIIHLLRDVGCNHAFTFTFPFWDPYKCLTWAARDFFYALTLSDHLVRPVIKLAFHLDHLGHFYHGIILKSFWPRTKSLCSPKF